MDTEQHLLDQLWSQYGFALIVCSAILVVAIYLHQHRKRYKGIAEILEEINHSDNPLQACLESRLAPLATKYKEFLKFDFENSKKSNIPASYVFNEESLCRELNANRRLVLSTPNLYVGVGLLGTFFGLTIGVGQIEINAGSQMLLQSISKVLAGMSAAFSTSIFGMFLSLYSQWSNKEIQKKLSNALNTFTNKLDEEFYIDDIRISDIRAAKQQETLFKLQEGLLGNLLLYSDGGENLSISQIVNLMLQENKKQTECLNSLSDNLSVSIQSKFEESLEDIVKKSIIPAVDSLKDKMTSLMSFKDEDGDTILTSNAIRDILEENKEQTKSMKSFSTDLAYAIQKRFEETLSKEVVEKILPMMKNIDDTTNKVVQHIDTMSSSIKSPVNQIVDNVVGQLTESMTETMQQFKQHISEDATRQLEEITATLGQASTAMSDLPDSMKTMSEVLQSSMLEVRASMDGMREANEQSSKEMMQTISLQFDEMVEKMGNSMKKITDDINSQQVDLMSLQENTTETQRKFVEDINKTMRDAQESTQDSTKVMMESVASSVQEMVTTMRLSIKSMTDELEESHKRAREEQSLSISEQKRMLSEVTNTIAAIEKMQDSQTDTLQEFKNSQGEAVKHFAHMQSLTNDLKSSQTNMAKVQEELVKKADEIITHSKESADNLSAMIESSALTSKNFVEQCETIKEGLKTIFEQMQRGIADYTKQVQHSTQTFLTQYANSLTETTSKLNNTIQYQSDVVEEMKDLLKAKK